jgi:hypothetical protein
MGSACAVRHPHSIAACFREFDAFEGGLEPDDEEKARDGRENQASYQQGERTRRAGDIGSRLRLMLLGRQPVSGEDRELVLGWPVARAMADDIRRPCDRLESLFHVRLSTACAAGS